MYFYDTANQIIKTDTLTNEVTTNLTQLVTKVEQQQQH